MPSHLISEIVKSPIYVQRKKNWTTWLLPMITSAESTRHPMLSSWVTSTADGSYLTNAQFEYLELTERGHEGWLPFTSPVKSTLI